MQTRTFFGLLFLVLLASRLCHVNILWEPEVLPMAAAKQMLAGKVLYRDIWYDKPPLASAVYVLTGANAGWVLRVFGAGIALLGCWIAYLFASEIWTNREGLLAAGWMAFFLVFDTPSAVIPAGPDLLMLVPHLAAVYLALRKKPFWSGLVAGVAFLCNTKALLVLAACAAFAYPALPLLAAGFVVPCALAAAVLWIQGAWQPYVEQVWIWSSLYAQKPFESNPLGNGALRTLNWVGFHLALVAAAVDCYLRKPRWRVLTWFLLSLVGVALGMRFFPRYYLILLPVLVVLASRGILLRGRKSIALAVLLLVPLIRFGPRYVTLAADALAGRQTHWSDTGMDQDSREAADTARRMSHPGDSLFVWGYRPELYIYTGMPAASRYLDSQAITGVPADRHLTQSEPIAIESAKAARAELVRTTPAWIFDGLSLYNPKLAIAAYPELKDWFSHYELVTRTRSTLIYRRVLR